MDTQQTKMAWTLGVSVRMQAGWLGRGKYETDVRVYMHEVLAMRGVWLGMRRGCAGARPGLQARLCAAWPARLCAA